MTDRRYPSYFMRPSSQSRDAEVPHYRRSVSPEQFVREYTTTIMKKTSTCHGNQKLRRFRRKWRKRGLAEESIGELIMSRRSGQTTNDTTVALLKAVNKTKKKKKRKMRKKQKQKITRQQGQKRKQPERNKRYQKDISKSLSQVSIGSPAKKKIRQDDRSMTTKENKSSQYLRMPKQLLYRLLRLQLHHPMKKVHERQFIMSRLALCDRQYCLKLDIKLYESYLSEGRQHRMWPTFLKELAKSNLGTSVERFLSLELTQLQRSIDQCANDLISQSQTCPATFSLSDIDSRLQEFVRLHHVDINRKVNYLITKLKDEIREQELIASLSSLRLTNEQKESLQILRNHREKQLKIYEQMIMFETRILCRVLPTPINNLDKLMPPEFLQTNVNPINNRTSSEQKAIKQQRTQIIELKRDMLHEQLAYYENIIEEKEFSYQRELIRFEYELSESYQDSASLLTQVNSYLDHYTDKIVREIFYKETVFRMKLKHPRRHHRKSTRTKRKATISVYPEAIVETSQNLFTDEELTLLSSSGPSYIRSNQSHLYKKKRSDKQTQKEYDTIMKELVEVLYQKFGVPSRALQVKSFGEELKSLFNDRDGRKLSYSEQYRMRRDCSLVHSIRRKLHRTEHILRVTDKSGVFHVGSQNDYETKVQQYQVKTNAYIELLSNPLMDTFYKVTRILNDLRSKNQITAWQHREMMPDIKQIELAYLYFIPKSHKEGTPLRPIVSGMKSPTIKISKLLDRFIRPLFDQYCQQTTIIDGVALIRRLDTYVQLGLLKPTTLLCTFDITDLYTMLPQEESIGIVRKFLVNFGHQHVRGMTLDAIEALARIVLTENVFVYNDKYYRQIKGGAMGSPFTLTLANIFMWHWEQKLVNKQRQSNELYGRYIDDIFLTSNDSIQVLQKMLKEMNDSHVNIKLTYEISSSVSFLDLKIEISTNLITTAVHHKASAEPYIVPFNSDHPRHIFANVIPTAIIRAIRYSSNIQEFNRERRNITLMLLYNGYPLRYIRTQYKRFYCTLGLKSASLADMIHDENEYEHLREALVAKPTPQEYQRAYRIVESIPANPTEYPTESILKAKLTEKQNKTMKRPRLILHYTHEHQYAHYKKEIHQIWRKCFTNTPVQEEKLIIGTKNSNNLIKELVQRAPVARELNKTKKQDETTTAINKQQLLSKR